jgi:hypothetical protein
VCDVLFLCSLPFSSVAFLDNENFYSRAGHRKKIKAADRKKGDCKSSLYLMMASMG